MKDNPSEELKKLEEQLLAVEDIAAEDAQVCDQSEAVPAADKDAEFEAFYQEILKEFGPDTAPRKKTSSTRKTAPKSAYSDQKPKKQKGIKGLVITLCLEMLGIAGIVLWWIFRIL